MPNSTEWPSAKLHCTQGFAPGANATTPMSLLTARAIRRARRNPHLYAEVLGASAQQVILLAELDSIVAKNGIRHRGVEEQVGKHPVC